MIGTSLKSKISSVAAISLFATVAIFTTISYTLIDRNFRENLQVRSEQIEKIVVGMIQQELEKITSSIKPVIYSEVLSKAIVEKSDDIIGVASNYREQLEADIFVIIDVDQQLITDSLADEDLPFLSPFVEAGQAGKELSSVVVMPSGVYVAVVTPFPESTNINAALIAGIRLGKNFVSKIAKMTRSEISIRVDSELINSTLSKNEIDGVLEDGQIFLDGEERNNYILHSISFNDSIGSSVGKIVYKISTEALKKAKNALIVIVLAVAGFLFLAVSLSIIVLTNKVTRPIDVLSQSAANVAYGDFETPFTVAGSDEIHKLSKNLEIMRAQIHNSVIRLNHLNYEKQEILDHIDKGILTFGQNLKVDQTFSKFVPYFVKVSPEDVAGTDVMSLFFNKASLDQDQLAMLRNTLISSQGTGAYVWELNQHHLPKELQFKDIESDTVRDVVLEWIPILTDDEVTKVMLIFNDLTKQKALESKVILAKEENVKTIKMITDLVGTDSDRFLGFCKRAEEFLEEAKGIKNPADLLPGLHTLKGESRLLNLPKVSNALHGVENAVKNKFDKNRKSILENVKFQVNEYQNLFLKIWGPGRRTNGRQDGMIATSLIRALEGSQQLLDENNITIGSVQIRDDVINWDPSAVEQMIKIINLALNNSLDHGYIRPISRGIPAKPVKIFFSAIRVDECVRIDIRDEGFGFDRNRIEKIAIQKKIPYSRERVLDLLFHSEFTTVDEVSIVSGQGVGLSAIKKVVSELGGAIRLYDNKPKGAGVYIKIPASRLVKQPRRVHKKAS